MLTGRRSPKGTRKRSLRAVRLTEGLCVCAKAMD